MNVFIHVPLNSCSNCSKTWGKAWCCEIWALALVVTVQDVHAKQRRVKQHMSRNKMCHNFSSNNIAILCQYMTNNCFGYRFLCVVIVLFTWNLPFLIILKCMPNQFALLDIAWPTMWLIAKREYWCSNDVMCSWNDVMCSCTSYTKTPAGFCGGSYSQSQVGIQQRCVCWLTSEPWCVYSWSGSSLVLLDRCHTWSPLWGEKKQGKNLSQSTKKSLTILVFLDRENKLFTFPRWGSASVNSGVRVSVSLHAASAAPAAPAPSAGPNTARRAARVWARLAHSTTTPLTLPSSTRGTGTCRTSARPVRPNSGAEAVKQQRTAAGGPPFCLRELSALASDFGASDLVPLQQRFRLRVPLIGRSPVL